MDRGDTAPADTGQSCMAVAWGASRPCIPAPATSACGVDDVLRGLPIRTPHKIQAVFLERGLKTVWPALFLHTFSSVSLNHPIDLEVGFMK